MNTVAGPSGNGRPFGVYVHVPFCTVRCGYCDFNTYTAEDLGPGASQLSYPDTLISELALDPAVLEYVAGCVEELNARLNRWETIKDFRILDHDLSVESGELTPSMKVKRAVVETNNKQLLDSFYA